MTAAISNQSLFYTLSYLVSMTRDPINCMQQIGTQSPSAIMMPTKPRHRGRRLYYLTGGENVRPIYNSTDTYLTSNVPVRAPGGGAQARLRRGLIGAQGAEHRHYRASFTAQAGREMLADFAIDVGKHARDWLGTIPMNEPVDLVAKISDLVRFYSVAMMFKDDDPNEAIKIGRQITEWIELGYDSKNVLFPVNLPGLPHARYRRMSDALEQQILEWADSRRGMKAQRDILSMFVNGPDEAGNPLSDARLSGHILTIYAAAFTSSVSAIIWAIFLLAQHPSIAHKLYDEINGASIDPTTDPQKLLELPYLDCVIKESMRLFTPVPYQVRRVAQDASPNDFEFFRRDIIVIGSWATNRLSSVYENANTFQPERWAGVDANNYNYLVFSAGPRRCVGYALAQIIVKVTLASILMDRRFSVLPNQQIDTKVAVTLRSRQPLRVKFTGLAERFEKRDVTGTVNRCYSS